MDGLGIQPPPQTSPVEKELDEVTQLRSRLEAQYAKALDNEFTLLAKKRSTLEINYRQQDGFGSKQQAADQLYEHLQKMYQNRIEVDGLGSTTAKQTADALQVDIARLDSLRQEAVKFINVHFVVFRAGAMMITHPHFEADSSEIFMESDYSDATCRYIRGGRCEYKHNVQSAMWTSLNLKTVYAKRLTDTDNNQIGLIHIHCKNGAKCVVGVNGESYDDLTIGPMDGAYVEEVMQYLKGTLPKWH